MRIGFFKYELVYRICCMVYNSFVFLDGRIERVYYTLYLCFFVNELKSLLINYYLLILYVSGICNVVGKIFFLS